MYEIIEPPGSIIYSVLSSTKPSTDKDRKKVESPEKSENSTWVAPSDIISNLFLEDLEKIWELRKWIPDPCNPHLHDLKQQDDDEE